MIRTLIKTALLGLGLALSLASRAQQATPPPLFLFDSPQGVYVIPDVVGYAAQQPRANGAVALRVERADQPGGSFRAVGRIQQAPTLAEFKQQAGEQVLRTVQRQKKLASEAAAWDFLRQQLDLRKYGLLVLSLPFRQAMGNAWLDADARPAAPGTRYTYRLVPLLADGRALPPLPESTLTLGRPSPQPPLQAVRMQPSDSVVHLLWRARLRAAEDGKASLFARLYRQQVGSREFTVVAERVALARTKRGDSLQAVISDPVQPGHLYRYFARPLDFVDNPGPASDTITVLSLRPESLPRLADLTARDTTEGLYLRWQPLPAREYFTGIEIQRSRDLRGDFVRLDTLPATATAFLDTRVLANVTYHYRARPLVAGTATPDLATTFAFGTHKNRAVPLAPEGLVATAEGAHVRLRWQTPTQAPDLDLDSYFVYRGTSLADTATVISLPLRGNQLTFLDTTARDGRRQYVYWVRTVLRSGRRSEFSLPAFARPDRSGQLLAPAGVSGYANAGSISLTWDDVRRRDPAVTAYRLYRRPAGSPAPPQLVATTPEPAYTDNDAKSGQRLEYLVAAVDAQGTESPRTAPAVLTRPAVAVAVPAGLSVRPVGPALEVSWAAVTAAGPATYALYRRTREQLQPQRVATVAAGQLRYRDAAAKPGTLYFYSVSAVAAGQEGPRTPEQGGRR